MNGVAVGAMAQPDAMIDSESRCDGMGMWPPFRFYPAAVQRKGTRREAARSSPIIN